ncbi:MAG: hypothetical protein ACREUK_06730 [Burkholderiales bacterium]
MPRATLAITFITAAIAFGLTGCGQEKKPEAPKPQAAAPTSGVDIMIGTVGPLTGSIAHLGKDNENGVVLAID